MRVLAIPAAFVIVALFACGATVAPAAPTLVLTAREGRPAAKFVRSEWTIQTPQVYKNPYDPDEIAVDATFTGPDGRALVVPAFWDQPAGKNGSFVVRFAPNQPGTWTVQAKATDSAGSVQSEASAFGVADSNGRGFIRRAANDRYLQFDTGESYFAIGLNLCWPAGDSPEAWNERTFATLASNGGNYARVWMCHPPVMLESEKTGLGKYDQHNAEYFDALLGAADRNNIGIMLCFFNHRELLESDMWGKAGWETTPYRASNGGPATRPIDFFTDPLARKYQKNRLRYIVARYGAFTSVAFWELFNEQENTRLEVPVAWNVEMAAYLHQIDPFHHLVTTSAAVQPAVWSDPDFDLTQTHIYGDGTQVDMVSPVIQAQKNHAEYHKPHFIGEMGLSYKGPDTQDDPGGKGTAFHNSLWSAMLSGSAGTSMYWWWDSYIEPKNLWHEFKPVAAFAREIDWAHSDLAPIDLTDVWRSDAPDAYTDLKVMPSGGWGDTTREIVELAPNGEPSSAPSRFLYGPQHAGLHSPLRIRVDLRGESQLSVGVSQVSDCAIVRVSVDDKPVRDFPFSALPGAAGVSHAEYSSENKLYQSDVDAVCTVSVPAGKHLVTIDAVAGDWVTLSQITFSGALAARYADLAAVALQDRSTHQTLAWIRDTRSNWKDDQTESAPPMQNTVQMTIPNVPDGSYKCEWFDTRGATPLPASEATAQGGKLMIKVPSFTRDIAVRVEAGH